MNEAEAKALSSEITSTLTQLLRTLDTPPDTLVVGFSGGVDSTFLLAALSESASLPVHAVYIHHGLSENALAWQRHCQQFCQSRKILFSAISVTVEDIARRSLEASAREARYEALLSYCDAHRGALILGQHQDDQLETLLLALKRGSGPAGLASMPMVTTRSLYPNAAPVAVLRPLLAVSRQQIITAARALSLEWIEDESNQDSRFDRNFLRNDILPAVLARWPQFATTAARSCELMQEQNALLQEVVDERFSEIVTESGTLLVSPLTQYSAAWQRAIVRHWITKTGETTPSRAQLGAILEMLSARADACPEVTVGDYQIRRYAQQLYITKTCQANTPITELLASNCRHQLPWWPTPFYLSGEGQWQVSPVIDMEKLMPVKNRVRKPTRKWLKEWKVPPWERERVPLISYNGEPLVVILHNQIVWLTTKCVLPADVMLVK